MALSFENNVTPKATDITTAKADNKKTYSTVDTKIENDYDGQDYFNTFNDAQSAMTTATSDAGAAIRKTQSFILAPARFSQSVKSRLSLLDSNFLDLRKNIQGPIQTISKNTKKFYEWQAGTTLNAIAIASSTPYDDDDYKNRPQIIEVINLILRSFARYLTDLDYIQTGSGGDPNDYVATAQTIIDINNLLNFTMSNLFLIGLSARQERFYVTPDKTDLISLAQKLYGVNQ